MRRSAVTIFAIVFACPLLSVAAAEPKPDPSFMHGLGQSVDGAVLELPKAILEGTLAGPPIVGTVMGALGGSVKALQTIVAGFIEMSAGFDPWGTKRKNY